MAKNIVTKAFEDETLTAAVGNVAELFGPGTNVDSGARAVELWYDVKSATLPSGSVLTLELSASPDGDFANDNWKAAASTTISGIGKGRIEGTTHLGRYVRARAELDNTGGASLADATFDVWLVVRD